MRSCRPSSMRTLERTRSSPATRPLPRAHRPAVYGLPLETGDRIPSCSQRWSDTAAVSGTHAAIGHRASSSTSRSPPVPSRYRSSPQRSSPHADFFASDGPDPGGALRIANADRGQLARPTAGGPALGASRCLQIGTGRAMRARVQIRFWRKNAVRGGVGRVDRCPDHARKRLKWLSADLHAACWVTRSAHSQARCGSRSRDAPGAAWGCRGVIAQPTCRRRPPGNGRRTGGQLATWQPLRQPTWPGNCSNSRELGSKARAWQKKLGSVSIRGADVRRAGRG